MSESLRKIAKKTEAGKMKTTGTQLEGFYGWPVTTNSTSAAFGRGSLSDAVVEKLLTASHLGIIPVADFKRSALLSLADVVTIFVLRHDAF